eukprot:637164-Prymnesium_polylepis.1
MTSTPATPSKGVSWQARIRGHSSEQGKIETHLPLLTLSKPSPSHVAFAVPVCSELTEVWEDGNEDVGLSQLTIEVYGCRMPADTRPICGDGLIMRPEQCDLGTDASNQTRNAYGASCSIGCTTWNPLPCTLDGSCSLPESLPPSGQDVSPPVQTRSLEQFESMPESALRVTPINSRLPADAGQEGGGFDQLTRMDHHCGRRLRRAHPPRARSGQPGWYCHAGGDVR